MKCQKAAAGLQSPPPPPPPRVRNVKAKGYEKITAVSSGSKKQVRRGEREREEGSEEQTSYPVRAVEEPFTRDDDDVPSIVIYNAMAPKKIA